MKTLQNHFKFNRMQDPSQRPGKKETASIDSEKNRKSIDKFLPAALLICSSLITLYGCGKSSDTAIL